MPVTKLPAIVLLARGMTIKRYVQTLPLHPPVEETAEVLQFVKRKALLKVGMFGSFLYPLCIVTHLR